MRLGAATVYDSFASFNQLLGNRCTMLGHFPSEKPVKLRTLAIVGRLIDVLTSGWNKGC